MFLFDQADEGCCAICCVWAPDACKLACGDLHCYYCMAKNLDVSINTKPFRELRCCSSRPIPTAMIRRVVGNGPALQRYRALITEHTEPARVYCSNQRCSAYIPSALHTQRSAVCRECHAKTCLACGYRFHFGPCLSVEVGADGDVPTHDSAGKRITDERRREARNDALFRATARRSGWLECPQCRVMVSKDEGCNRMTCHCGCGWCYNCGRKECDCGSIMDLW